VPLHQLWSRRHSTKFNGASYPVQKAAAAVFSPEGKQPGRELIEHYMGNAKLLREACRAAGLPVFGGENAPYVWVGCPPASARGTCSTRCSTRPRSSSPPAPGFGSAGEGYFRISAFNSRANVEEVCRRLKALELRQNLRLKLPDAVVLASAEVEGCILVTRNTRDFPHGDPRVRFPYVM
jgi:LL-diaminopimelate aminotransferase